MNIIKTNRNFMQNLDYQFYNRREIIVNLIDKIGNSSNLDELGHISPCAHKNNIYFIYDAICKMYFEYLPKTNQIKPLNFTFVHHDF